MTLRIYDIMVDEFREPIQEDIDRLAKCEQALGVLLTALPVLRQSVLDMAQGKAPMVDLSERLKGS